MKTAILYCTLALLFSGCDEKNTGVETCGDGIIDIGEECDGEVIGGYSCLQHGYYEELPSCTSNCRIDITRCIQSGSCGDGVLQGDYEGCDGESLGGATCGTLNLGSGQISCNQFCEFDTSQCEFGGVCGNDTKDGLEGCDGEDTGGEDCESLGYHGGTLFCTVGCKLDLTGCETAGRCGNSILEAEFEECDGADLGGVNCETVDEHGYYGGTLTCTEDCTLDLTSCEAAGFCGDGIIQAAHGETCDQSVLGNSTCLSFAYGGGTLGCSDSCAHDPSGCTVGPFATVATGYGFTCVLNSQGRVWCWGANDAGQLGNDANDATPLSMAPVPVNFDTAMTISQLSVGGTYACALSGGEIFCWGEGKDGQLGNGSTMNSVQPVQAINTGGNIYTFISAGANHACALTSSGDAFCWGNGTYGRLGDGASMDHSIPDAVISLGTQFTQISAGFRHTCAVDTAHRVWCWGLNDDLQCGVEGTTSFDTPQQVEFGPTPPAFVSVGAGGTFSCALTDTGAVWCWGRRTDGRLGLGDDYLIGSSTPVLTLEDPSHVITDISTGMSHTCTIDTQGHLLCWGKGINGRLGVGDDDDVTTPTVIDATRIYTQVSTSKHNCALEAVTGDLYCWGDGEAGQLGNGALVQYPVPLKTFFD
ncbi:hypothetical protein KKF84_18745 [Myxococcota bacterium]|nr:hypothetical protein [Myxococcota bacterium]